MPKNKGVNRLIPFKQVFLFPHKEKLFISATQKKL